MSKLKTFREKLNLTQEELCDQSGISVRTIQRIEAGTSPKGQTLKILAKTLGIQETELLDTEEEQNTNDTTLLKLINLSSLPFIIIPPANIIIPLIIMYVKKQFTPLAKQIVTIQILWLIFAVIIFFASIFILKWLSLEKNLIIVVMLLLILINVVIILRNSKELDKKGKLFYSPKFSII